MILLEYNEHKLTVVSMNLLEKLVNEDRITLELLDYLKHVITN